MNGICILAPASSNLIKVNGQASVNSFSIHHKRISMAVEFVNLGEHKNVYGCVFGDNDVHISSAIGPDGRAMIMFNTEDGQKNEDYLGRDLNELPCPEMVLIFEDAHTIASLCQMLLEMQKHFMK